MSSSRVLCFSEDERTLEQCSAPLEWSYPHITVLQAESEDDAVRHLEHGDVDTVVTDAKTMATAPAILQAVRERYPNLPMLVLSPYSTDATSGTAISEVVDFVDGIGDPGSDEAFAGWVANAVVGGHTATPPGGNRPEDVVRDVKRGLVDAESPRDIQHAVCDQLTMGGRYVFAWIGEYDRGEHQVVPWVTGSAVDSWPINRTFPVGGPSETLVDRALRTREMQVATEVDADAGAVPWSDVAVDHGCTATAVVPLVADDELYGVLGLYSDSPGGFDEMERSALREIGASVSKVLHTMALRGQVDQQERTLRRYERLVETVGDGMYALDSNGHFMTVNNGLVELTGYSREGMLGEHVSLILDDEDAQNGRRHIRNMLDEDVDETSAMEMEVLTKDGRAIPCETKIALLVSDGDFRGTVGVVRDITERKERERELRRQNERLEAFAGIVSHDLRNPLGVAQGYLELAKETGETAQLEHVTTSLDRMEDIIADVLALARHGQTVTETELVNIAQVATEAWANVETGGATVSIDASTTLRADRSRLMRLLENLFRNAVEHGGDDVHVDVGDAGGGFYVADDGDGIPPGDRARLFESDFTTADDGFGLGLWVVKEVADAHGWETRVESSESGGARFEFVADGSR